MRPDLVLAIEGSDEEGVVYRGWPWRIEMVVVAGTAPTSVGWSEPGGPPLLALGGQWYVAPEASAATSGDRVELCAGNARVRLRVAAAPSSPTPRQVATLHRLQVALALARGDLAAARAAVDAWCAVMPQSVAALGARADVRLATGDKEGALAAFSDAIGAAPPGSRPVASVHRRYGALLRELVTKAADDSAAPPPGPASTKPPASPSPPVEAKPAGTAAEAPPGALVPTAQLDEARIVADAAGQWASAATAGSQYSAPDYGAGRATGAPDVPVYGNSTLAWCPGSKDDGTTWLEIAFTTPVAATGVRVRQNEAPGAIVQVEAIADDGSRHVWWRGVDAFRPPAVPAIAWFGVDVPKTTYRVAKLRLTLDLAAVPGWNQIDAVQLVGAR